MAHDTGRPLTAVPAHAYATSLVALAIPVAAAVWFPHWMSSGLGMLTWLTVLIPAFLLSYYRGLRGAAMALAGGMVVIAATQLGAVALAGAKPDWSLLAGIVVVYITVSLGVGGIAEALLRQRHAAQAMALVDSLTGMPNRRHLEILLAGEFASAERGRTMSVIMFDLDHFKVVNDERGHAAGDHALQVFARILQTNTRLENLSARYGGEEFVTVLRDATRDEAEVFAARVLDETRAWPLPWGHQTVSAGVAEYENGMGSYELLLGAADLALYRAKEAGRDCVCVAPKSSDEGPVAIRPAAIRPAVRTETTPGEAHAHQPSAACVWVVDDSAHMRSVLKGMLARWGYDSWVTANPLEAIRRFATLPPEKRPDVIVADIIMPEMSGIRMIGEITKLSKSVRVIYMSGFVQSPISWGGTPGEDVAFLEKPVTMEALSAALKRVLEPGALAEHSP